MERFSSSLCAVFPGIIRSLPASIWAVAYCPPNQSLTTIPLKPHSWRSISVTRSARSLAIVPLILLYDVMTVQGCVSFTTISKGLRYISLNVRGEPTTLLLVRLVSWLFSAKCFSDVPTPLLCMPFTTATLILPASSGSSL